MEKCIIKGHGGHELELHRHIVQKITGVHADMLACPTGNYRFFVFRDHSSNCESLVTPPHGLVAKCNCNKDQLSRSLMFKKPRFGWAKDL